MCVSGVFVKNAGLFIIPFFHSQTVQQKYKKKILYLMLAELGFLYYVDVCEYIREIQLHTHSHSANNFFFFHYSVLFFYIFICMLVWVGKQQIFICQFFFCIFFSERTKNKKIQKTSTAFASKSTFREVTNKYIEKKKYKN